jgi:MGT family glycosyltransferase
MTGVRSFLFTTFEGGGSVPPMLTVARRVAERGHRVRVMSDACNQPECEAAGATFVPWSRAPSKAARTREHDTWDDWSQADPREGFRNLMDNLLVGPALEFAQDTIEELRREPADLVVGSEMLFGVPLGCEAIGQRHVLLAANIPLFPLPGHLPLGPGLTPPSTDEERAFVAALLAESLQMYAASLPALNDARRALGLPPLSSLMEQHDAAQALLFATSHAFDFAPPTLSPRVAYVGPQLDEPVWAQPWSPPHADDRPLALVAFSTTFQNHARVLQRVIDAISTLPMRAVVTLGGSIRDGEVRGADNVEIVASAPHGEILKQATLVVTHGGHGTVMKALAHRCPMLILPHGRDQEDNAARVTARGAGLKLDRGAGVEEIRAALSRLLTEPAFADGARRLGERIAEDATNSPIVEVLEALAAGRAALPRSSDSAAPDTGNAKSPRWESRSPSSTDC